MIFAHRDPLQKILHIVITILFFVSLLSGLRLAFDNPYMSQKLLHSGLIPQGDMFWWHELSAYFWLAIIAFSIPKSLYNSRHNKPNAPAGITIQLLYLIILLQCLTGLVLYLWPLNQPWQQQGLILSHYFLAYGFTALVIVHLIEKMTKKSWGFIIRMFIPRSINRYTVIACGALAMLAGGNYYYQHHFHTPLHAKKIPLAVDIRVDGKFDESAWHDAPSVTISTMQGNDYFTTVPIEIKMLHNGLSAYFALRWPDSSPSYTHLPLIKTKQGWQVQHDGFAVDDERTFYEDKMAVMLSKDSGLAGGYSIHLGKQPLDDKPASRSGRGFHYTTDNSLRDVWHWKAVRVERMSYLDDNHFMAPAANCEACPRYKAGYDTDPKDSGSFRANWTWFLPDTITPLRQPMNPTIHHQVATASSMSWFETKPYSTEQDNYPIGTTMPSVLTYEGFEGDRANVNAKGFYQNGHWHLELARNLTTESDFDLPIDNGIYIWLAPFDHAQSRHGYHLKPLKLVLNQ